MFSTGLAGCADDADRVAKFMANGEAYVAEGKHEEAVIEFKNVLQIEPENPAAHEALSIAYLETNKPREAYWEMSETVRLDPDNVEARLRYGTISSAIGENDLALEQAEAVLALDPQSAPAFILRAQAREAKEDYEGSESDYKASVDADPKGAAYRFLYAGFLERRGRFDEAEKVLRDLLTVEESYIAYSMLARVVARSPDRDADALPLLEKTVEFAQSAPLEEVKRGPKEKAGMTSLVPNFLREEAVRTAYLLLSGFHYTRGRFDEAIAVLEEGVTHSKSKIELIYQMARLNRLQGRLDAEAALIERATKDAPDSVAAQLVQSLYLSQKGDLPGALAAARKAVEIEPENRGAQLREAELLVDVGFKDKDSDATEKGRAIVEGILEKEPDNPEAHFVKAKIALTEADVATAKASLETVLQARPEWAQARYVLGSTLTAAGEYSRARAELSRAVELDPQQLDARKLLAKVHAQLGEHEFAIEQGRAYLAERPDDSDVRIVVGQSLIRVGRGEEAYKEVEKIPEEKRDAGALFALGRLDLAFGRMEQGLARLLKADEMAPGNAQVLRVLLSLDREKGKLADSVARIAKAAEANPKDSALAELQGEAALLSGDTAAGRKHLERAIEIDARNVGAQLALADVAQREGKRSEMIEILERAAASVPESADLQYPPRRRVRTERSEAGCDHRLREGDRAQQRSRDGQEQRRLSDRRDRGRSRPGARAGPAGERAAARRWQRFGHARLGDAQAWRSFGGHRLSRGGVGTLSRRCVRGPGHRSKPPGRGLREERGSREGDRREPQVRRVRRTVGRGGQEAGRDRGGACLVLGFQEADRATRLEGLRLSRLPARSGLVNGSTPAGWPIRI